MTARVPTFSLPANLRTEMTQAEFIAKVREEADALHPPLVVIDTVVYDSFDNASVALLDGPVTWTIQQERSVPSLEVAAATQPDERFSLDDA